MQRLGAACGLVAFVAAIALGLDRGDHASRVALSATVSLAVFAAAGLATERLADWLIDDSLARQCTARLARLAAATPRRPMAWPPDPPPTPHPTHTASTPTRRTTARAHGKDAGTTNHLG